MEELVRLSGVLCAAAFIFAVAMLVYGGRKARLMELQLAKDTESARKVIPTDDDPEGAPLRRKLNRLVALDFGFIALYWLAFVSLAVLLLHRDGRFVGLAGVAFLLGTAAAFLDVLENLRTIGVLSLKRTTDQLRPQMLDALRASSLSKWWFAFLTTLALSALFWRVDRYLLLGLLLAGAAVLGLVSVIKKSRLGIAGAFVLQGLGLGVVALVFLVWADSYVKGF